MSSWISGRSALRELDMSLARLRKKLSNAMDAADEVDARSAEVRQEQVTGYRRLAEMRMSQIEAVDFDLLDRLHRRAHELMAAHADYVDSEARTLAKAEEQISALERMRRERAEVRQEKLDAYEATLDQVETDLVSDPGYTSQLTVSDEASAIAQRAEQKLSVAIDEREEKGAPYRDDPLFWYLWERRYRTPDYKGGGLFRMLDHWVARLCKYDEAHANFARLNDVTDWLTEHAASKAEEAETALAALEALELAALEDAGANKIKAEAEALAAQIAQIDQDIVAAETRHGVLAEQHAAALAGKKGPAIEARNVLEQGLRTLSFTDLRRMAAETVTLEDDETVDDLVKLRTEQLSLELEDERISGLPSRLKNDLSHLEGLRRKFKSSRFDSDYTRVKAAILEDAIEGLLSGRVSADKAFRHLRQSVRRSSPKRRKGGFGARHRMGGVDLDGVLGDIAVEVLKEVSRGGSKRGPSLGRRTSWPSRRSGGGRRSSRRRGGFKTGGGF
ncbi:MAG: hypothetical protein QNI84_00420 [Henriciella sp.]|nr:hypothetical protein [Henriciella sp.]